MGIKHFFYWFKTNFSKNIKNLKKTQTFDNVNVNVENLMIDCNGLFHASTQKIYEYGNCKPPTRLMGKRRRKKKGGLAKQISVFKDICFEIEKLLKIVNPSKRLILCVDGPAPISKQNQQRQRRFRSAMEKDDEEFKAFDSNCITPGTKFMDYMTKYIDWYIRKRLSEDQKWQNLEIIFSNEKSPGEGEHKLIQFIRFYGGLDESYCIHGLDADLIMLGLGTHAPKFWVLREDLYNPRNDFFVINIGKTRLQLADMMKWEKTTKNVEYDPVSAINDFIFMCFMVGNDFLPHIPSLEIIEGGIQCMIDVCKNVGESYGHLTESNDDKIVFRPKALEVFLGTVSQYDKDMLEDKLKKKDKFFPDPLLDSNSKYKNGKWNVDIKGYKKDYYNNCFNENMDMKKLCHEYLEGLQWVLSYYTQGVPNWKWCFKHHYAPFAREIAKHVMDFKFPEYGDTIPTTPYQQLLSVLPPKSYKLIPYPLCTLLTDPQSLLKKFCPDKFVVDIGGKRQEWEGIVLLPMVDFSVIKQEYFKIIGKVDHRDIKRNKLGKSYVYFYDTDSSFQFRSFYGNIDICSVRTEIIEL